MKTLYLILILIIIFGSNYITLKLGEQHYNNNICELFDIFHIILPDLHNYENVINYILFIGLASLYFLGTNALITEYISKLIIILLVRAFTIISTILPKHNNCDEKLSLRSFIVGGCYDKIFSGHTAAILLLTLLYFKEHIINIPSLIGINLINTLLIIATRSHYTIDVLLAVFVTFTIDNVNV